MTEIYVDADACPVKKEIERIAIRHNLETFLVCDGGIRPSMNPLIKNIFVNQGADAADDWIVDNIERANICVTNDIPLAGRCLKRGAFVIKPNGNIYDTNKAKYMFFIIITPVLYCKYNILKLHIQLFQQL